MTRILAPEAIVFDSEILHLCGSSANNCQNRRVATDFTFAAAMGEDDHRHLR